MTATTYSFLAIFCAALLPCTWYQARHPEIKMPAKGLYLLGTCLLSGLLALSIIAALAG